MDEPIAGGPRTVAEYRAALAAVLAELERLDERSERTWAEIERLKAESVALQAENEHIKASIDRRLQTLVALL
jgi:hypothetical protein